MPNASIGTDGSGVLRGEGWLYQVGGMRERVVVLVSAQAVIDNPAYRVLYGIQVADTDPGHVLAVSAILNDTTIWLDAAAGLMAVRRSLLTKHLGTITPDVLASLDARLAAALDH
jgi:hypothetical protein